MYVDGPATSPLDYSREQVNVTEEASLILVMKLMIVLFFWIQKIMRDILTGHWVRREEEGIS